jgi:hypothetical protein
MATTPERVLEAAEKVRAAYLADRKLQKVDVKVQRGHGNLVPFRDRLAEKLATTLGGRA